jgi:hypothetical protein
MFLCTTDIVHVDAVLIIALNVSYFTLLYFTEAGRAMYSSSVVYRRAVPVSRDAKFLMLVQFILSEVLLLTVIR